MDGIVVMPLVGAIDTARSGDIMRTLLRGITEHRARIAIIDITGVPVVDSGVADHLNRTIQAARLKGAQTIITGISDAVAEAVVDLGIDWSGVETLRSLQSGLVAALERLGVSVAANGHNRLNGHNDHQNARQELRNRQDF
jgi:rsbT co-antagonist protein RsbR